MRKSLNELFERGKSFIKSIAPAEKLFVIYHSDVDGVCSAAICCLALKKLGIKVSRTEPRSIEEAAEKIDKMEKHDSVIILDLAIDFLGDKLKVADKKILLIDHHVIRSDMNDENFVYINPRFENPEAYQPVAYIAYKFFSELVDLKDKEWIAALGTIGDYGFEDCKDLLENFIRVRDKQSVWKTDFGSAAILIGGAASVIGYEKVLDELTAAKNLDALKKNENLAAAYAKYEKDYKKSGEEFWRTVEKVEEAKLMFAVICPKYRGIGSSLASALSRKHEKKIIVISEKIGDKYKVHARYQTAEEHNVNLAKLLEKLCKELGGRGGGHERAAGGTFAVKNVDALKKKLVEELKKKFKK